MQNQCFRAKERMGGIEELPDDGGACPKCGKFATTKCSGCGQVEKNATQEKLSLPDANITWVIYQVYYCNRACQKADWKMHKPICKKLPYKIASSKELGNFMVANKDLKQGEVRSIYENKNQK